MNITFALDEEVDSGGASGVLQALLDYSMGRIPRIVTMQTLGIDDYAVLICLLNAAHLPHPVVPLATRKEMAAVMVSTTKRPIRIVLPDTGPLISLALGESLELLLSIANEVRIVLTDVVEYEATHRADDLPDAQAIRAFLRDHANRLEIMPTTIGSLALADLERKARAGLPASLPKDLGELSITNFVMSLRTSNPGDPMLVIIEDDWFAENAYAVPGNIHLLSTSAWLDGLEALGLIPSASDVRSRIQSRRPNFRADFFVDQEARKVVGGTEWRSGLNRPGAAARSGGI